MVTSAPYQAAFLVREYLVAMVLLKIPGARGMSLMHTAVRLTRVSALSM